MSVTCPACSNRFAFPPDLDPELGTYCPDCGHGFIP